jgi:hypothetical protein
MTNSSYDSVLSHFGIKGMQWGVRKASSGIQGTPRSSPSDFTPSKIKRTPKPANSPLDPRLTDIQNRIKSGHLKTVSNEELQALVTRMNLERQLKSLQPPTKKQAAAKFAREILLNIGKQQISKLAADLLAKQVGKVLAKTVLGG